MSTYEELSLKLKSSLGLKGSPVAVKLVRTREELPAGVPEIGEKVRHCEMVQKARNGDVFYATKEKHACAGGAGALGVAETPPKVLNGEFYFSLGDFATAGSAKRTTGSITRVDEDYVATLYAPLEKAAFKPDVVVIIGNPRQMMRIAKENKVMTQLGNQGHSSGDDIWVTANFKEDQLRYMRPGQRATISVDAYGKKYNGHVQSIAGASGALFSLLPPENATGNYVKVVQRIPVKITFDPGETKEHILRPGMSVEPKVWVR
jgi:hypothetical protein